MTFDSFHQAAVVKHNILVNSLAESQLYVSYRNVCTFEFNSNFQVREICFCCKLVVLLSVAKSFHVWIIATAFWNIYVQINF